MSRIGKKPVHLPKGVTASVDGKTVKVKGPKGELSVTLVAEVEAKVDEHGVHVTPHDDMERAGQMWGLSRTLVNNLVRGVTDGFAEKLEIQGVGYRAAVSVMTPCGVETIETPRPWRCGLSCLTEA